MMKMNEWIKINLSVSSLQVNALVTFFTEFPKLSHKLRIRTKIIKIFIYRGLSEAFNSCSSSISYEIDI